jgi:hypothetical protein
MKSIILGGVLVASAMILFSVHKSLRKAVIHFVQEPNEVKKFDFFPPDIPTSEFESVDFV